MRLRLSLFAIVMLVAGAALAPPGAAAAVRGDHAAMSPSALGRAFDYLASVGVDPGAAVVQQGTRNYAGPDCPGDGWNCTSAQAVVIQISSSAAAGGDNTFDCSPGGAGTNPATNTCMIVQVSTTGDNRATCHEVNRDANPTQTCNIMQTNIGGKNTASVRQTIDQDDGSVQGGTQTAMVMQINGTGTNDADVDQSIKQESKVDQPGAITQSQNGRQDATVCQGGTTSCGSASDGDNDAKINQDLKQKAKASGDAGIDQQQNAAPGQGTFATINQHSVAGRNSSDLRQGHDLDANANSTPGPVNQEQGSFDGGLVGTVNQASSGVSTNHNDQNEKQNLHAKTTGTLTQTQIGPLDCCSSQGTNAGNRFNIHQRSSQMAGSDASQSDMVTGNCSTSGNCKVTQKVNQNGTMTNNSCNDSSCSITIECVEGEGGEQSCTTTTGGGE